MSTPKKSAESLVKSIDAGKKSVDQFYRSFPELQRALAGAMATIDKATQAALTQIDIRQRQALGAIALAHTADNSAFMVDEYLGDPKNLFEEPQS